MSSRTLGQWGAAIAIISLVLSCAVRLTAAEIVWTNTAGGNWGSPANWAPNLVPGPPDTTYITNAGTYVVRMDVDATVSRIFVGGASGQQTLDQANVALTLSNASTVESNGIFRLAGGLLEGAGDLLIEGNLDWHSGTIQGSGRIIFPESRPYRIEGGGFRFLGRTLELRGGGVVADARLAGLPGGVITVFTNQTLEILETAGFRPGGIVQNLGIVRKTGSADSVIDFAMNNNGVLQSAQGRLALRGGGLSSGTYDVLNDAALDFADGVHIMTNGTEFSTVGSGRLRAVGTVEFASAVTVDAPFELSGTSTLRGQGDVTFAGGLYWSGGTMEGPGRTIIPPQASLVITGIDHGHMLFRNLDLQGNGTVGGQYLRGNVFGGYGATLAIFPGATLEIPVAQRFLQQVDAPAIIHNRGTLIKRSNSSFPLDIGFVFKNDGLVQVVSGGLGLNNGGASSGAWELADGSELLFGGGTHEMNAGTVFTAVGSAFIHVHAGLFRVNHELTVPRFQLNLQGGVDGDGNITFSDTLTWYAGSLLGRGLKIVPANSRVLMLGNSFPKFLQCPFELRGYGSFFGISPLIAGAGGRFIIASTGTFDLFDDPAVVSPSTGVVGEMVVQGALRKTEGTGTAVLRLPVTNTGLIDAQSGGINFAHSFVQNAGVTLLSGGHLTGERLIFRGGQLRGAGAINAPVSSAADVFPGNTMGTLQISTRSEPAFAATSGGTLNIELGGHTAGIYHDQLRIDGSARLGGVLNVDLINDFLPAVGSTFTILTFTSYSGSFAHIDGPPGVHFVASYLPTSVVLTRVLESDVLTPLHTLVPVGLVGTSTNRSFLVTMTGEPARHYEIYSHTNVAAPFATWTSLGLMTRGNRLFEYRDRNPYSSDSRFYRARQVP